MSRHSGKWFRDDYWISNATNPSNEESSLFRRTFHPLEVAAASSYDHVGFQKARRRERTTDVDEDDELEALKPFLNLLKYGGVITSHSRESESATRHKVAKCLLALVAAFVAVREAGSNVYRLKYDSVLESVSHLMLFALTVISSISLFAFLRRWTSLSSAARRFHAAVSQASPSSIARVKRLAWAFALVVAPVHAVFVAYAAFILPVDASPAATFGVATTPASRALLKALLRFDEAFFAYEAFAVTSSMLFFVLVLCFLCALYDNFDSILERLSRDDASWACSSSTISDVVNLHAKLLREGNELESLFSNLVLLWTTQLLLRFYSRIPAVVQLLQDSRRAIMSWTSVALFVAYSLALLFAFTWVPSEMYRRRRRSVVHCHGIVTNCYLKSPDSAAEGVFLLRKIQALPLSFTSGGVFVLSHCFTLSIIFGVSSFAVLVAQI